MKEKEPREKQKANKEVEILSQLEKAKIERDARKEAPRNWSTKLPSDRK